MSRQSKLDSFMNTTSVCRATALHYLEQSKWKLDAAVDHYYDAFESQNKSGEKKQVSVDAINAWFDEYADPEENDVITGDGIIRFCIDIEVDPQAIDILIIAWKMKANDMCSFSREEFCQGMHDLACDTKEKLVSLVPNLRSFIETAQDFKNFYSFCFEFSKEEGQKSLAIDIAIPMWSLLLIERFPDPASDWLHFLNAEKPCKGITRDTWDLLLDFFVRVDKSYDFYSENEAWPVLIDDFMGYKRSTTVAVQH